MSDPSTTLLPRIYDANPPGTLEWLAELVKDCPPHPEYGINFENAVDCPIVTCVVAFRNEVLLAKRSSDVLEYPDTWATIGGFMRIAPPAEVILQELDEEVGIKLQDIESLTIARRRLRLDPEMRLDAEFSVPYRRRWHEFRSGAILRRKVDPITNWENRLAAWVPIEEAFQLPLLRSTRRTLESWRRVRIASGIQK